MNNIWFFGCSHSTGQFNLNNCEESWTYLLAKSLNYQEINFARPGNSNDGIFLDIVSNLQKFKSNDKIFILLTFPERIKLNKKNMVPSDKNNSFFYKVVNDDDFFTNKFLQICLAIKFLLKDYDYKLGFVDPTLLFKLFEDVNIKNLIKDEHSIFFPKITLTKSFTLGKDNKHLSVDGHQELYKFVYKKL